MLHSDIKPSERRTAVHAHVYLRALVREFPFPGWLCDIESLETALLTALD